MNSNAHEIVEVLGRLGDAVDTTQGHEALDAYAAMNDEERTFALSYAWEALMSTPEAASLIGMLACHKTAMLPIDQAATYGMIAAPPVITVTVQYTDEVIAALTPEEPSGE